MSSRHETSMLMLLYYFESNITVHYVYIGYRNGAGNTVDENCSIFSVIRMR